MTDTKRVVANSLTYRQAMEIRNRIPQLQLGYMLRDDEPWDFDAIRQMAEAGVVFFDEDGNEIVRND